RDDRDVFPGIERHAHPRQLDIENRRRFGVEARAIRRVPVIPVLELHHDLDAFLMAHGADAEERRDVDDADASNLPVVPLKLVAASDEDVATASLGDHQIVGDESVSSLDEIEHALGFTDATLADEQQPDAEYVREGGVQVRRRRELVLEPGLDSVVELVGLEVRADDRYA